MVLLSSCGCAGLPTVHLMKAHFIKTQTFWAKDITISFSLQNKTSLISLLQKHLQNLNGRINFWRKRDENNTKQNEEEKEII